MSPRCAEVRAERAIRLTARRGCRRSALAGPRPPRRRRSAGRRRRRGDSPRAITAADLNADGRSDLARNDLSVNRGGRATPLMKRRRAGAGAPSFTGPTPFAARNTSVLDHGRRRRRATGGPTSSPSTTGSPARAASRSSATRRAPGAAVPAFEGPTLFVGGAAAAMGDERRRQRRRQARPGRHQLRRCRADRGAHQHDHGHDAGVQRPGDLSGGHRASRGRLPPTSTAMGGRTSSPPTSTARGPRASRCSSTRPGREPIPPPSTGRPASTPPRRRTPWSPPTSTATARPTCGGRA